MMPARIAAVPSRDQLEAESTGAAALHGQAEEYLSIADLSKRIPYAPQTIRNLMGKGVFKRNVHYVKPRGRVVFVWSAVEAWLQDPGKP